MNTFPSLRLLCLPLLLGGLNTCQPPSSEPAGGAPVDTVRVYLLSYSFEVERDTFVAGQPYRFVFENRALIEHEWAVVPRGTRAEEAILIEVEGEDLPAGATAEATFRFPEPGAYDFACFLKEPADHYELGMVYPVVAVPIDE